ncbi:glyceraldehyde 3-phosphate dehydrogenase NAD-binding domain-containing protein, partial [Staphylococcus aureus]|uniref:glyceraldehyde 3-phosphate dehydrogenase NAD-binding domain-containing protein n=1 Tax=Staphylococcus aureus TaxID=1280 RepID=UPI0037DA4DB2
MNRFARIARLPFRRIQQLEGLQVLALNHLTDHHILPHLLKYHTIQPPFTRQLQLLHPPFPLNPKQLKSFTQPDATKLPSKHLNI